MTPALLMSRSSDWWAASVRSAKVLTEARLARSRGSKVILALGTAAVIWAIEAAPLVALRPARMTVAPARARARAVS
jgi:sugar/nucleoside kinase (ribokinase family)